MTPEQIVQQIVSIFTSGFTGLGAGIGAGISSTTSALAFTGTGETQALSIFFIMVCVFAAIAICIGLTTRIFTWLSTLGN